MHDRYDPRILSREPQNHATAKAGCLPPRDARPVDDMITRLSNETSSLSEAIGNLADRLDKVLAPTGPECNGDSPQYCDTSAATSALTDSIRGQALRIGALTQIVGRLTSRLEV